MQDFPANSAKARERSEGPPPGAKKIEQVTSVEAEVRKRGLGRRFKEIFIGADARTTLEYTTMEVVIPGIRDMVFDAFQTGLERMIYGESRVKRGSSSSVYSANPPRVNYQSISSSQPSPTRTISRRSRTRHDFGEIVIQSRREAVEVIDRMFDILSRYGSVSVADLYELTGIQSGHTDTKWGWTSLRGAREVKLRNGSFVLDLPEPESLER